MQKTHAQTTSLGILLWLPQKQLDLLQWQRPVFGRQGAGMTSIDSIGVRREHSHYGIEIQRNIRHINDAVGPPEGGIAILTATSAPRS
jgi:hypothetical protein